MKNKTVIRFLIIFVISFFIMEGIELSIEKIFNINLHGLKWGWIGFIIIYGFKYHVFCCLLPAIWAGYKCRHKKCKHEYCEHK